MPLDLRDAIDCDVHVSVPGTRAIAPYLDPLWREHVELRGIDDLELMYSMPSSPVACRADWRPAAGKPGASYDDLKRHALDAFGCDVSILNVLWGAAATHAEDLCAVLCRAVNDWIAAEWLDRDPRLRASVVVPLEHPERAVEEIERRASDRRFVQVLLLAMGEAPLGKRRYWPIYEAAERHGFTIGIHAGTTYRHAPSMIGWPAHYVEDYVAQSAGMQSQLLSLIYEGVLSRHPALRFVFLESGVTWLPGFLWRADKTWRGLRMETPWLKEAPSGLVRRQVRMTASPLDAPENSETLFRVLEQFPAEEMLLFASDWPHWRFEGDAVLRADLPESVVERMTRINPLETYPRLSEVKP
jgi:predicted TIM-barrel fold metal-dependent hydrolase